MRSKPATVGIAPGAGLVARFGGVVVYLAEETASTDRILGAVEAVAEAEYPGAALAKRLAAVVFGNGSDAPPFGVLAPTDDGTLVLLRGAVFAEINGAEGTRRLDGGRALTWVDEIVREPVRRITVGTDTGTALKALPRTDLRAGVVPGGGYVWQVAVRRSGKATKVTRASAAEPDATAAAGFAAAPEPTGTAAAVSVAVPAATSAGPAAAASSQSAVTPAVKPKGSARSLPRPRPPVGARPAADRQLAWSAPPGPVALHKNPDSTRMLPASATQERAVGTLILENGTAYPLDRTYVIGRGPQADDAVRAATAAPIVIQRDRHVSRVHAYVSVDAGKVYVRDAATTTSGTFIAPPGTDQWTRITTSPTELLPGWSVRISERVLTFRADDQP